MRAEIIAVGSELLTSSRLETNSLFITRKLNELGIEVTRKWVVSDLSEEIEKAFCAALLLSEVVVLTGGLGPTNDDITREVIAQTLGLRLTPNVSILDKLIQRFQSIGIEMTDNNRQQAMVPEGAEIMENHYGSAPGLFLKEGDALIFLLPGPPRELEPMFAQVTLHVQQHKQTSRQYYRQLKVASETESRVDFRTQSIYQSYPQIETTILSSPGIIDLLFYWVGEEDEEKANRQLGELITRIRGELGVSIFADKEEDLEVVVGRLLRANGKTLATAESCTGGLIGKIVTDVPDSSDYYRGGVVCYSDELKMELLNVSKATLEQFGAVSEPVASQMAVGVRRHVSADLGLSVTGIAGPSGGTKEKPVGLIYLGLSTPKVTEVRKIQLPGDRDMVRLRSARLALDWVRRHLL